MVIVAGWRCLAALLLVAVLSACGHSTSVLISNPRGMIVVENQDTVIIQPTDGRPAVIDTDGTLRIAGQHVALSPIQKAEVAVYADAIKTLLQHGHSGPFSDVEGMGMAADIFSSLLHGTAVKDHPQRTKSASVRRFCEGFGRIARAQTQLTASLPRFKSYQIVPQMSLQACRRHMEKSDRR